MGNKLAVLAGDVLVSRACVALASLKNIEVQSLLATVLGHLVTGETMQITTTSDQSCRYAASVLLSLYKYFLRRSKPMKCNLIFSHRSQMDFGFLTQLFF